MKMPRAENEDLRAVRHEIISLRQKRRVARQIVRWKVWLPSFSAWNAQPASIVALSSFNPYFKLSTVD